MTKQSLLTAPVPFLNGKRRISGLALAIAAAAVSGVLLITLGAPMQLLNTAFGVWFAEVFAFLAPGWIILRWNRYDPLQFVGARRPTGGQLLFGLVFGAANFLGIVVPLQFLQQPLIPQQWKEEFDTTRLFQNQSPLELVVIVAAITIAAPFCEEFVFRGMIQKGFAARFTERVAIFITAVLFSAFHLDPVGLVSRVELGIVFGVLYQRSGSLWPGAMAHAANNLVSASIFFVTRNAAASTGAEPPWLNMGVISLTALCSLAGLSVMIFLTAIASRKPGAEASSSAQQPQGATEQPIGPLAEDESHAVASPSLWRLLLPWLAAAGISFLLLIALDRRGVALNLYDLSYHLPPIEKDAPIAERRARDRLQALRAKARRGEVPIAEYLSQRKALRAQLYQPGRSRKTRPPTTQERSP